MIIKLLIFGLLCGTAIQAFPSSSDLIPEHHQLPCDKKIAWFRNITENTKKLYDEYYKTFGKSKPTGADLKNIETEHKDFENKVDGLMKKYEQDSEELHLISNSTARLAFCQKEIDWYRLENVNLTGLATHLKSDVLKVLDQIGVPKEVRDNFDKTLSRIVNFLFIIDLTKNLFKDVVSLVKQCWTTVEDGIALEKEMKVDANGEVVEAHDIVADYDDKVLEDNTLDNEISHDVDKLSDNSEVNAAEERAEARAEERLRENQPSEPENGSAAEEAEIAENEVSILDLPIPEVIGAR